MKMYDLNDKEWPIPDGYEILLWNGTERVPLEIQGIDNDNGRVVLGIPLDQQPSTNHAQAKAYLKRVVERKRKPDEMTWSKTLKVAFPK
jgi:hypothetical protein